MTSSKRIYSIDILRFIAALAVVMYHYAFRGPLVGETLLEVEEISSYFKYGYLGVHLFFIISGFVILLSVQQNSVLKFVKSRIVRLYPAFWFCVLISFSCIYFLGQNYFKTSFLELFINLTMFNSFVGVKSIDGVYWSLHIELFFYFLILCYLLIRRIWPSFNEDRFILSWLILSFTTLIIDYDSHLILKLLKLILIFKYSSFFIAGMLFFKIYKRNHIKYKMLLVPTLFLSVYLEIESTQYMIEEFHTNFSTYITSLFIIGFYVIFYLITTGVFDVRNRLVYLKFGLLTYPLYLIHQVVGFIIFNHFVGAINDYVLLNVVILFMLIFSFLINKYIERPISEFLKRKLDFVFKYSNYNWRRIKPVQEL